VLKRNIRHELVLEDPLPRDDRALREVFGMGNKGIAWYNVGR